MIQDLRKYTDNFLFKLLLGFISVTFVISFGVGSFFGDRKEVIARIDETEILQRDFQRMYGQQLESLRQQLDASTRSRVGVSTCRLVNSFLTRNTTQR